MRLIYAPEILVNLFQSAPGQLAGRCTDALALEAVGGDVSIRARPIGRAMPGVWSILISSFGGFNPRPANWPGDAANLRTIERSLLVSIRARPIGRAMLVAGAWSLAADRFQSAPGQLAGRCSTHVTYRYERRFLYFAANRLQKTTDFGSQVLFCVKKVYRSSS
jgi:hypothetical protein